MWRSASCHAPSNTFLTESRLVGKPPSRKASHRQSSRSLHSSWRSVVLRSYVVVRPAFWWDNPAFLPDVPCPAKSWKCPAVSYEHRTKIVPNLCTKSKCCIHEIRLGFWDAYIFSKQILAYVSEYCMQAWLFSILIDSAVLLYPSLQEKKKTNVLYLTQNTSWLLQSENKIRSRDSSKTAQVAIEESPIKWQNKWSSKNNINKYASIDVNMPILVTAFLIF